MTESLEVDSADQAAQEALAAVETAINDRTSFLLEAGAGAGKTYSLVQALQFLIANRGAELLRQSQRVACITYTNAATDEIRSRTDGHPAVLASTIHAFCWSLLEPFQAELRKELPNLPKWAERLDETGGMGRRDVRYELGYPSAKSADHVSLSHDDVLLLMAALLERPKFRALMVDRYPVILIDEYQDTNRLVAESLVKHFLDGQEGLLLGFFGDHWQTIYRGVCGAIVDDRLVRINKHANFRSVPAVVEMLNRMRPELRQIPASTEGDGGAVVYHTNSWPGVRQTGSHWRNDLPSVDAHNHLDALMSRLRDEGWDFEDGDTKVLMLTHNVLAQEQGYSELKGVFKHNEQLVKKEDDYIAYFADILEPAVAAYGDRRFGEMAEILGGRRPPVRSHSDKQRWAEDMDALIALQEDGTVGEVLDHLARTSRPRLSPSVERKEEELKRPRDEAEDEAPSWVAQTEQLRDIPYKQVRSAVRFIEGYTPFETKHGVKGLEFENVLVVVGKGWNQYNFDQMLNWAGTVVPANKEDTFERSRNLFYVVCSRPKTRLALLFTEKLSPEAMTTLEAWFGSENVTDFQVNS